MYRFIDSAGREHSTDDVREFVEAVHAGQIGPETLVFSDEVGRWKPAIELDVFRLSKEVAARGQAPDSGDAINSLTRREGSPCPSCGHSPFEQNPRYCSACGEDLHQTSGWTVVGIKELSGRDYSVDQLMDLVAAGRISPSTRVIRDDMVNPVPMRDHGAFAGRLETSDEGTAGDVGSEATDAARTKQGGKRSCPNCAADLTPSDAWCPNCTQVLPGPDRPQSTNIARPILWGPFAQLLPRATRRGYLFWCFVSAALATVAEVSDPEYQVLLFFVAVLAAIAAIMAAVGRFHDAGQSGWWVLLGLVPIVNIGAGLYLLFAPPTEGKNRYGPNPRHL